MNINFIAIIVAALIHMIVGFIYYRKKVFGSAWMSVTGMKDEKAKKGNRPVTFIVSFLFSILLAIIINVIVVHQFGLQSLFDGDSENPLLA